MFGEINEQFLYTMDDLRKQLVLLIGGVVILVFTKLWNWLTTKREKAEKERVSSMELYTEVHRYVRHAERKMMIACHHIMRMHVIHFSNGTETDAGLHLRKVTFLHEVVQNYTIEPIAQNFQEHPMPDMFVRPISTVMQSGQFYLRKKSDLNETDVNDVKLGHWLGAYHPEIKSMLWLAIRNKAGKTVAILCMYFPGEDAVDDRYIIRLKDMNQEIEKIYHDNFKKKE